MTWLQFLIGTEGMLAIAQHGVIGVLREGLSNFCGAILLLLLILLVVGLLFGLFYMHERIANESNLYY